MNLLSTDQNQVQDEKDPEIDFKIKTDNDVDDLSGVIRRRGPNPASYQLHFDDMENDSNGNETILARAPESTDSVLTTDTKLNTNFGLLASESGSQKAMPSSESTFRTNTSELNEDQEDEALMSLEHQDRKVPASQESLKGVKFDMDINEQSTDVTEEGDSTGSFGISALQGDDTFNQMSTSKSYTFTAVYFTFVSFR